MNEAAAGSTEHADLYSITKDMNILYNDTQFKAVQTDHIIVSHSILSDFPHVSNIN